MSNDKGELKSRDKVVTKMTWEGAVEENLTDGNSERISKRLEEAKLVQPPETREAASPVSEEDQKALLKKRQVQDYQEETQEHPTQTDAKESANGNMAVDQTLPNPDSVSVVHPSEGVPHVSAPKHGVTEAVLARKLTSSSDGKYVDSASVLSRISEKAPSNTESTTAPVSRKLEKLEKRADKAKDRLNSKRNRQKRSFGMRTVSGKRKAIRMSVKQQRSSRS